MATQKKLFGDDRYNDLPLLTCQCGGELRWSHIHNPHNDVSRPWGLAVRCASCTGQWKIRGDAYP